MLTLLRRRLRSAAPGGAYAAAGASRPAPGRRPRHCRRRPQAGCDPLDAGGSCACRSSRSGSAPPIPVSVQRVQARWWELGLQPRAAPTPAPRRRTSGCTHVGALAHFFDGGRQRFVHARRIC